MTDREVACIYYVSEGDCLKGKEGMLPMTLDVKGDVNKPTPYGYFDTATNTIRIDENELKKAEWVSRKDITGQPNPGSMTHEMMMWFKDHEV